MRYAILAMLFIATGCGMYNAYDINPTRRPFVARQLLVRVHDYHTHEPLAGARIVKEIVMADRWVVSHPHTNLGVQETSADGTAVVTIDQPGTVITVDHGEYIGMFLQPIDRVYVVQGFLLKEHQGQFIAPLRLRLGIPIHPDWLGDEYKLPRHWTFKNKKDVQLLFGKEKGS